jgi:putative ABC transport system permease protein
VRSPVLLAWKQLTHERLRFVAALFGVAFSSIMMLMQLGFREALLSSCVQFHRALDGGVVLISPQSSYLVRMKAFPRNRLYAARGDPDVVSVAAVYTGIPDWKNPQTGIPRGILAIGFDPAEAALNLPGVAENLDKIRLPDRVLFDRAARPEYGPVARELAAGHEVSVEVGGRRVQVVGLFRLGTSFGIDGSLVTSDLNFFRFFPDRSPGAIDVGLVKLAPGADARAVARRLSRELPSDVLVLTRGDYAQREIDYWASSTPVGYVFTLGTIIGFVVGAVIVYQILFTDISHHLPEYATLKAIGYTNLYLAGIVVSEALFLAVAGFLPGLFAARELFGLAERSTQLPMRMSGFIGIEVLGLTLAMCCLAGLLAMRKLSAADPAEIF